MKIESTEFTRGDVEGFLDELRDHERLGLAGRMEQAAARLGELGPRIQPGSQGEGWTAHEVLAHIAAVAKFYGVLTYQIASGRPTELDVLNVAQIRDPVIVQMAAEPAAELVERACGDLMRTAAFLRRTTAADLRRRVDVGLDEGLSAFDLARLVLTAHTEMHLDQLEKAL